LCHVLFTTPTQFCHARVVSWDVTVRKFALDRLMSPFVVECVDSFRDAYSRTGMNLAQSMVVLAVAMSQHIWRTLANRKTV
jgi:hypothetical protein